MENKSNSAPILNNNLTSSSRNKVDENFRVYTVTRNDNHQKYGEDYWLNEYAVRNSNRPVYIAWPCDMYTISIPWKKVNKELDIFEETVLRLTALTKYKSCDKEEKYNKFSELLSIEKDLIIFILHKLSQNQYIDDKKYNITDSGAKLLETIDKQDTESQDDSYDFDESKTNKEIHRLTIRVFSSLAGESRFLLPFIDFPKIDSGCKFKVEKQYTRGMNNEKNTVRIVPDITKLESYETLNIIPQSLDSVAPSPINIINTIKIFFRKIGKFSLYKQYADMASSSLRGEMYINENPEKVLLKCRIVMLEGNQDLLVTDGLGLGFSLDFIRHINQIKDKLGFLSEIVKNSKDLSNSDKKNTYSDKKETNDNSINGYIHNIMFFYRQIEDLNSIKSRNEAEYLKTSFSKGIQNIFSALELTFKRFLKTCDTDFLDSFQIGIDRSQVKKNLIEAIKKYKFDVLKDNILVLSSAKLDWYNGNIAGMIAASLLSNLNINHKLKKLAETNSNVINELLDLKRIRDNLAHGNYEEFEKLCIKEQECYKKYVDLLKQVLPLSFKTTEILKQDFAPEESTNFEKQRNILHEALINDLGIQYYYNSLLSSELKEKLVNTRSIIPHSIKNKQDFLLFVGSWYEFMQDLLKQIISRYNKNENILELNIKNEIAEIETIFKLDGMSETFTKVGDNFIKNALLGGTKSTLGACCLAFLHYYKKDFLKQYSEANKYGESTIDYEKSIVKFWVETWDEVIKYRGHGNGAYFDKFNTNGELISLLKKFDENCIKSVRHMIDRMGE